MKNDYCVQNILGSIIANVQEYKKDINVHGIRLSVLIDIIELLVNETSKLKTIVLEMPKTKEEVN